MLLAKPEPSHRHQAAHGTPAIPTNCGGRVLQSSAAWKSTLFPTAVGITPSLSLSPSHPSAGARAAVAGDPWHGMGSAHTPP